MSEGIFTAGRIYGTTAIPGSKHFTQRYILMSAFSGVPVELVNLSGSEDEEVAAGIARSCGASVIMPDDSMRIEPRFRCPDSIYAGESATSLRLAFGLLAGKKCRTEIRMAASLRRRNSGDLIESLASRGARFSSIPEGIAMDASDFTPGHMEVSGELSSQFVSSLLMMHAVAGSEDRTVTVSGLSVSRGYIDITAECIREFGPAVSVDGNTYTVKGEIRKRDLTITVETDISSLSAILVLGILCSEKGITCRGITPGTTQPDLIFPDLLRRSGFSVEYPGGMNGDMKVRKSAGKHLIIDANLNPDLAVIASVIGIFSRPGVTLLNTSRLAGKESDRRASVIELAEAFGADVSVDAENIHIKPSELKMPEKLSFRDHRMVMAAIIASLAARSRTVVGELESLGKSYPGFTGTLQELGVTAEIISNQKRDL